MAQDSPAGNEGREPDALQSGADSSNQMENADDAAVGSLVSAAYEEARREVTKELAAARRAAEEKVIQSAADRAGAKAAEVITDARAQAVKAGRTEGRREAERLVAEAREEAEATMKQAGEQATDLAERGRAEAREVLEQARAAAGNLLEESETLSTGMVKLARSLDDAAGRILRDAREAHELVLARLDSEQQRIVREEPQAFPEVKPQSSEAMSSSLSDRPKSAAARRNERLVPGRPAASPDIPAFVRNTTGAEEVAGDRGSRRFLERREEVRRAPMDDVLPRAGSAGGTKKFDEQRLVNSARARADELRSKRPKRS